MYRCKHHANAKCNIYKYKEDSKKKDPAAVALATKRTASMILECRKEIASAAVKARWKGENEGKK
jgi:hypothetical protein